MVLETSLKIKTGGGQANPQDTARVRDDTMDYFASEGIPFIKQAIARASFHEFSDDDWSTLSVPSFARDWDSEEDSLYDSFLQ